MTEMNAEHIAEAERRIVRMHQAQLAWADTSSISAGYLLNARTRAAISIMGRLGTSPVELDYLRLFLLDQWSVEGDRSEEMFETVGEWLKGNGVETELAARIECAVCVLHEMWWDVVIECDEWARRHCS